MASVYPGGLDSFPTNRVDGTATPTTHPTDHNDANDAVNKIEATLGINPQGTYADVAERLGDVSVQTISVRNLSGSTILKGRAVAINGSSGQLPTIALADADSIGTLPSVGLAEADIPHNSGGSVRQFGMLTGTGGAPLNTSAFSEGDRLFVSTTAGVLTATEPSHPNLKQRIAVVANSHATQGKLLVLVGAVRGDHEGTNRNTWIVGDGADTPKSLTFREAHDNVLSADTSAARTWTMPDKSGKVIVNEGLINTFIDWTAVADPAAPAAGVGRLFGKSVVSGQKMQLKWKGPTDVAYLLQPSLFQQQVTMFGAGGGTTVGIFGTTVSSTGTVSHAVPTASLPYAANFVTAATGNAAGGTAHASTPLIIGNTTPSNVSGGMFVYTRWYGPDASYSDYRWFCGITSTAFTAAVTEAAAPASWTGHRAGFYAASDHPTVPGRWYFRTRNNTTTTETAIGTRDFTAQHVYDMYIFIPKGGTTVYWRIDNLTAEWTEEGSTSATLPGATTALRSGAALSNVTAVARNIRIQRHYTESDV